MKWIGVCMLVADVFDFTTLLFQLDYNKNKKSIYGLSYDYYFLSWLSYFSSIVVNSVYFSSHLINAEYAARFPIYPYIFLSMPLVFIDLLKFITSTGILVQLFILYKNTRNVKQGVSPICKLTLLCIGIVGIVIFYLYSRNWHSIKLLDFVDFVWLSGVTLNTFKFLPQLWVNWFGMCVTGICPEFTITQIGYNICLLLGNSGLFVSGLRFFEIPVNYKGWYNYIIHSVALSFLVMQQEIFYKGLKPSLKIKIK